MDVRRVRGLTKPARVQAPPAERPKEPEPIEIPIRPDGRPYELPSLALTGKGNALELRGEKKMPKLGSPAFEQILDDVTGSTRTGKNKVDLLFDGTNSFAERNKLIAGAKSSIHLQTFIFTSDETGWELARMLAAKAKEGVAVRVIYDKIGSMGTDSAIFDMMREAGVEVRGVGWEAPNQRWHEKHLIVDGEVSIEGGMNIANKYAYGGSGKQILHKGGTTTEPWRDCDVRVEGPAVNDAQRCFLKNWKYLGGTIDDDEREELLRGKPVENVHTARVRVVQHRPCEDGDQHTQALYCAAIRASRKSITIENAYFVPTKELKEALLDALKRGVQVRIMTNSETSNDMGFVTGAARWHYDALLAAGAEIYERQGTGTLHAKTATFDDEYSIVGSCNLNGRSALFDSEVCVAINDEHTARRLKLRFADGLSRAVRIDRETARGKLGTQVKQWLLACLSDVF